MKIRDMTIHRRSLAKTISWRVIGTGITFSASFLLTGRIEIAGSIGLLDAFIKIFFYYFHEHLWLRRSEGD